MVRDDVEQWSRVQQLSEYRALMWTAEQCRRRYRFLVAVHDLLCSSTEKRPDPVERSVTSNCRLWSRIRWSTQSNAADMSSRLSSVTFRSSDISMSDRTHSRAVSVEWPRGGGTPGGARGPCPHFLAVRPHAETCQPSEQISVDFSDTLFSHKLQEFNTFLH